MLYEGDEGGVTLIKLSHKHTSMPIGVTRKLLEYCVDGLFIMGGRARYYIHSSP